MDFKIKSIESFINVISLELLFSVNEIEQYKVNLKLY
jgi:hypothetical protein